MSSFAKCFSTRSVDFFGIFWACLSLSLHFWGWRLCLFLWLAMAGDLRLERRELAQGHIFLTIADEDLRAPRDLLDGLQPQGALTEAGRGISGSGSGSGSGGAAAVLLAVVPQTGLPVWGSYSFQRVASLGRVILSLSSGLRSTLSAMGPCFYTCLPLASHLSPSLGALDRMIFHLSPTWFYTCLPHFSPTLGALGRTLLHLSPTCLRLRALWAAWFYTCLPLVCHTCLPLWVLWAAWFHNCLPLVSQCAWSGPHDFRLVSYLSPTLVALGRMILHLSPTVVSHPGRFRHVSPTCPPHLSPTLVSRSGCSGSRDFTLVSHFSHAWRTICWY